MSIEGSPGGMNPDITSGFWKGRLDLNRRVSLPGQWEKYLEVGTVENFHIAARGGRCGRRGYFYTDSDLHKWADAAARALESGPDSILEDLLSGYAELMEAAIEDDGYLYTWNQIYFPSVRWKNLRIEHELYCMGHFIEAAVSYRQAAGSRRLLDLAVRTADLITAEFARDRMHRFPGHQEIELALVRLYRETGETRYRDMAEEFLANRGRSLLPGLNLAGEMVSHMVRTRKARRMEKKAGYDVPGFEIGENPGGEEPPLLGLRSLGYFLSGSYLQEHRRFDEQVEPKGHSVRWAYGQIADAMLAGGMTAVPAHSDSAGAALSDPAVRGRRITAAEARWDALVGEKTYITGGIGSLPVIEGFGRRFELDNRYSYSETCAAIASAWWNRELAGLTGSARYADMVERLLYNGALVGLSLDGRRYTYRNPLESAGGQERREWFSTACCPSNISRFQAGLPGLIACGSDGVVTVDQYVPCRGRLTDPEADLELESGFPWDGGVRIRLRPDSDLAIRLRVPGWCGAWTVAVDGNVRIREERTPAVTYQQEMLGARYEELSLPGGRWTELALDFPMRVRGVVSRQEVAADRGKTAICRGPLVFCREGDFDAPAPVTEKLEFVIGDSDVPGVPESVGALSDGSQVLIPCFAWANRERLPMKVWFETD